MQTPGPGDDLGKLLERVDLLGHGAAHGRCRFLRLLRQVEHALLHLGARLLELGADGAGGAAHLLGRTGEALRCRFHHLGDGAADLLGGIARPALRRLENPRDEVLEGVHDALDVLGLLHQSVGELFQRLLALIERRGETGLGRAQEVGGAGENLAVLLEASRDARHFLERAIGNLAEAAGIGLQRLGGVLEHVRRPVGVGREFPRRRAEAAVDLREVAGRDLDELAQLVVGGGKPLQQVRNAVGQRRTRALHRRQRLGGAVGERVDQRLVLGMHALGGLVGHRLDGTLELAAARGELLDQRTRGLVEDARDLRGARGEHRIELAGALLKRHHGLARTAADMIVDRGEGLGKRVRRRNEVGLGGGELLADLAGHSLGILEQPPLGLVQAIGDVGHCRGGAARQTALDIRQGVGDRAGAGVELGRGLMRPGNDALVDLVEIARHFLGPRKQRVAGAVGARRDPRIRVLEGPGDRFGALGQRFRRLADARGHAHVGVLGRTGECVDMARQHVGGLLDARADPAVGIVEDLRDGVGLVGDRPRRVLDACGDAAVRVVEDLRDGVGLVADRLGGILDARGDAAVGVMEDLNHRIGLVADRAGSILDAKPDTVVRVLEDLHHGIGLVADRLGRVVDAQGDVVVGLLEHLRDRLGLLADLAGGVVDAGADALVGLLEDAGDRLRLLVHGARSLLGARGQPLLGVREDAGDLLRLLGHRPRGLLGPRRKTAFGIVEGLRDLVGLLADDPRGLLDARGEPAVGIVERVGDLADLRAQQRGGLVGARGDHGIGLGEDLTEFVDAAGQCERGLLGPRGDLGIGVGEDLAELVDPSGQRQRGLLGTSGDLGIDVVDRAQDIVDMARKHRIRVLDAVGDLLVGVLEDQTGLARHVVGDLDQTVAQRAGDDAGAALQRGADVIDAERQRLLHRRRALLDHPGLSVEGLADTVDVGRDGGGERQPLFADLGDIGLQRASESGAGVGQLLHVAVDGVLDPGLGFGQLAQVGVEGAGEPRPPLCEHLDMAGHRIVDALAGLGDLLEVVVQRHGHLSAAFRQTLAEIVGAAIQHDGRGGDEVGELAAQRLLAVLDDGGDVALAEDEGVGDLARALHQGFVDVAGPGLERGVQLLGAGVERFRAGLELRDQRRAALRKDLLDAGEPRVELLGQRLGGVAEHGHHAGRAAVEQVGKRARDVVGAVGERRDARVEHAGEGLARRGDAIRDHVHALVDRLVEGAAAVVDALDQRIARIGDRGGQELRRFGHVRPKVAGGHVELGLQMLVHARDRSPYLVGMLDDGLALGAQPVDQHAHARLVVGIGAFELVDLGMDDGLELHRARDRALDAFAHGRHLAADGLADHHDAVLGERLGLRQPEGGLGHRLGRGAHLLRALHHDRESPEEDDGDDDAGRDAECVGRGNKLGDRADLPDRRRI